MYSVRARYIHVDPMARMITAEDAILPVGDGECVSGIQDGGSPDNGNIFVLYVSASSFCSHFLAFLTLFHVQLGVILSSTTSWLLLM